MKTRGWSDWGLMPQVAVWQAVALSLNVELQSLHRGSRAITLATRVHMN